MPLNDIKNFLNKRTFSSKHVSIFLPRKYDIIFQHVTATLRALFAHYVSLPSSVTRMLLLFRSRCATWCWPRCTTPSSSCSSNKHLVRTLGLHWLRYSRRVMSYLKEWFKSMTPWLYLRFIQHTMNGLIFVESPIHEFQYLGICDFLYELWRTILLPRILNHRSLSFSFNPRKLVAMKK